jgi:hypothetical protein
MKCRLTEIVGLAGVSGWMDGWMKGWMDKSKQWEGDDCGKSTGESAVGSVKNMIV